MKKRLFFMLALLMSAFNGWAQDVVIDHVVYRLNDEKTEVIAEGYADGYSSTTEGPHIQTEVTFDGVKYPVTTIGYYAFMGLNLHASDADQNGSINVGDITTIVDIIMKGEAASIAVKRQ